MQLIDSDRLELAPSLSSVTVVGPERATGLSPIGLVRYANDQALLFSIAPDGQITSTASKVSNVDYEALKLRLGDDGRLKEYPQASDVVIRQISVGDLDFHDHSSFTGNSTISFSLEYIDSSTREVRRTFITEERLLKALIGYGGSIETFKGLDGAQNIALVFKEPSNGQMTMILLFFQPVLDQSLNALGTPFVPTPSVNGFHEFLRSLNSTLTHIGFSPQQQQILNHFYTELKKGSIVNNLPNDPNATARMATLAETVTLIAIRTRNLALLREILPRINNRGQVSHGLQLRRSGGFTADKVICRIIDGKHGQTDREAKQYVVPLVTSIGQKQDQLRMYISTQLGLRTAVMQRIRLGLGDGFDDMDNFGTYLWKLYNTAIISNDASIITDALALITEAHQRVKKHYVDLDFESNGQLKYFHEYSHKISSNLDVYTDIYTVMGELSKKLSWQLSLHTDA